MKGSKTILISTHDMEEADILGDRIAILHAGQFRSYGTSFFLKKILGNAFNKFQNLCFIIVCIKSIHTSTNFSCFVGEGNVEVNLSIEPWCDTKNILSEFDPETKVINEDGGKLVLSTKISPHLPDLLDKIENRKEDFGVSGLSVSLITLEQVFLK